MSRFPLNLPVPGVADGTGITWGHNQPKLDASPHIHARCALLDALQHNNTLLDSSHHANGPYFDTMGRGKLCYQLKVFDKSVFAEYGLDDLHNIQCIIFHIATVKESAVFWEERYRITASANVVDARFNPINGITTDGEVGPVTARCTFEWSPPTFRLGEPDIVPSLNWKAVAAIIANCAEINFENDGTLITCMYDLEQRQIEHGGRNPLLHLGYLGWSGYIPAPGSHIDAFKYDPARRGGTAAARR